MKKLFLLLALAGVMVACGDEKKKDEKKADNTEATQTPEATQNDECCGKCEQECNNECGDVCTGECGEECCEAYTGECDDEMCCGECDEEIPAIMSDVVIPVANNVDALVQKTTAAIMNGDEAALGALEAEFNKLSAEDQAKFEAGMMAAMGM